MACKLRGQNLMNRNQIVDIAKGIGILFVVFGHNPIVSQLQGELFNVIFSFHMPLFFFLSGIFFKPNESFSDTLKSKADSLLKPYFTTLLLIGIAYALLKNESLISYLIKMLYGNGSTIKWIPLWFLTHLFAVIAFSWVVNKLVAQSLKGIGSRLSFLVLMLATGVLLIQSFWQLEIAFLSNTVILPGLPFSLDIVLITSSYFLLGHYLSESVLNFKPKLILLLANVALFVLCHYFFDRSMNLNARVFNGYAIATIQSLSAIYIILSISYYAQLNSGTGKVLSALGVSSIFILIFHDIIQSKTYTFAATIFGEKNILPISFSFLSGVLVPMLIMVIIKRFDYLSFLYMPMKSKKTYMDQPPKGRS